VRLFAFGAARGSPIFTAGPPRSALNEDGLSPRDLAAKAKHAEALRLLNGLATAD
jgi:hypothetical protein